MIALVRSSGGEGNPAITELLKSISGRFAEEMGIGGVGIDIVFLQYHIPCGMEDTDYGTRPLLGRFFYCCHVDI